MELSLFNDEDIR
jgi:hypothetical protein